MPRFRARTIAVVRRNVNEMLTDTCRIERQTGITGTMGEPLNSWETVATEVPCRVIRSSLRLGASAMQVVGSQESMVELYRLICPVGTGFTVDDRVTLSDDSVYQVVNVEDKLTDSAFSGAVVTRVRT
jgi:hypothetical protein